MHHYFLEKKEQTLIIEIPKFRAWNFGRRKKTLTLDKQKFVWTWLFIPFLLKQGDCMEENNEHFMLY